MFTARGTGAHADFTTGTVTVTADITDDRTGTVVLSTSFSGTDLPTIRQTALAQLQAMAAADKEAQLNAAVVGQIIAHV